jgi:hypothetical protein
VEGKEKEKEEVFYVWERDVNWTEEMPAWRFCFQVKDDLEDEPYTDLNGKVIGWEASARWPVPFYDDDMDNPHFTR